MKKTGILSCAALAALAVALSAWLPGVGEAAAQRDNSVVMVPVTLYDFRSNRSNPEFEQPHMGGVRKGMIANTLDADNKPVAASPQDNMMNQGIRFWFRDWNSIPADQKFRPIYMYRGSANGPYDVQPPRIDQTVEAAGIYSTGGWAEGNAPFRWVENAYEDKTIGGYTYSVDTAFKNIVVRSELRFTLQANGLYRFASSGTAGFFPLDNQGFSHEGKRGDDNQLHNFAFTMEMVYPFEARSGMVFNFSGDDDVWVFINNRLVLDIGGIHGEAHDNFRLDDVLTRDQMGREHTLRVFYAERHTTQSNILIETNIVSPPGSMELVDVNGKPVSEVKKDADQTVRVTSILYDETGTIEKVPGVDYNCDDVVWTIVNSANNRTTTHRGCHVDIADSIAGTLNISASYRDPAKPNLPAITKSATMTVYPLTPESIHIQQNGNPKAAAIGEKSDPIYFDPSKETVPAHAVLYDKYGNHVPWGGNLSNPSGARWESDNTDVATVNPFTGSQTVVRKEVAGEGSEGQLIISYTFNDPKVGQRTLRDTVYVGSKRDPGIAIGPNPFNPRVDNIYTVYRNTNVPQFYDNVIRNTGNGQGSGLLVAVDAPKTLKPQPGGKPGKNGATSYGKVIIYDAVGNVVRTDDLYKAQFASSYGYVWDGKNMKGRTVGPGTYLVRITGKDTDGNSFFVQKKAGVTKR